MESACWTAIALLITARPGEACHPLRYMQEVGDRLSLRLSALGKATLALGTPEEAARQLRLKPLRKLCEGTITDLAVLEAQVEQTRRRGWIWVENEGRDGLGALDRCNWAFLIE